MLPMILRQSQIPNHPNSYILCCLSHLSWS